MLSEQNPPIFGLADFDFEKRHIAKKGNGEPPSGGLPFLTPRKITVATVATVADLAREFDSQGL